MAKYADTVAILSFLVEFLLILGTNSLFGYPAQWKRTVLASAISAAYATLCALPQWPFFGHILWRFLCLLSICIVAFGVLSGIRRWAVLMLLHAALEGVAIGLGSGGAISVLLSAVGLLVLCLLGFLDRNGKRTVTVVLSYGEKKLCLRALQDTGNLLRDPLTGRPVLVIGADAAQKLTGLTKLDLQQPVETLRSQVLPGLQLIPYESIGCTGGLLLGLKLQKVTIGSWKGSTLVAFAPEGLGADKPYQALLGGSI